MLIRLSRIPALQHESDGLIYTCVNTSYTWNGQEHVNNPIQPPCARRGGRGEYCVDGQLHLISLSQLSGGTSGWESPFNILIQWLRQTNLPIAENPWMTFLSLSPTELKVTATLVYPSMFWVFHDADVLLVGRYILESIKISTDKHFVSSRTRSVSSWARRSYLRTLEFHQPIDDHIITTYHNLSHMAKRIAKMPIIPHPRPFNVSWFCGLSMSSQMPFLAASSSRSETRSTMA